jgi:serine/threonine protein phosphatase PrpC
VCGQVLIHDFAGSKGSLYAAVYDGHGGRLAVEFVTAQLHALIARELASAPPSEPPTEALKRGFLKVDRMLLQCGAVQVGTTAAVCVCVPSPGGGLAIHVANAGDTRALLLSESARPTRLSVDHVPSDPAEAARIREAGGRVMANRVGGTLAVSRALGDHCLKGSGGGVTAEPHTVSVSASAADRFVVLASDGVWDVVTDDDAHALVMEAAELPPAEIASRLVGSAMAKGTRDNVSALVVRL